MIQSRAAYRYAKAMLDISREQKSLDVVVEDFLTIERAIEDSRELQNVLATPVIDVERKSGLLIEVFRGKVSEAMLTFLRLIAKKGRSALLWNIAISFRKQLDVDRGLLTAEISTAVELKDGLKREIESRLEAMTGKKVQANYRIDKSLIGGYVARIDDRMIDASVRHQLDRLHETLAGEAVAWTATL